MRLSGFYIDHADGTIGIVGGQCTAGSVAINRAIKVARNRQAEQSHFIPSHEFVGPELPLQAAMRQLRTDDLNYTKANSL